MSDAGLAEALPPSTPVDSAPAAATTVRSVKSSNWSHATVLTGLGDTRRLWRFKASRDSVNHSTGRGLVVLKTSVVDTEFKKLALNLRTQRSTSRMVSTTAYEAGGVAGASLPINPGISEMPPRGGTKGS